MAHHLNQFRELANQLQSLSENGKRMDDSELVTILTLSLPASYEPLVMALQSRSDTITFDLMARRLLQESGRRQISQVSQASNNTPHTAFTARPGMHSNKGVGSGPRRFTSNGRGGGGFRNRYKEPTIMTRSATDYQRTMTPTSTHFVAHTKCHYCGKNGHWKKDCHKRKGDEGATSGASGTKEFTFLAEDIVCMDKRGWIIDSGASQHLSHDRMQFSTYKDLSPRQSITIADGSKIDAYGTGDIQVPSATGEITLTEVWHVPNIGSSLISVSRMVDAGYKVEFEQSKCYVSNHGITTQLGYRHGSLYYLTQHSKLVSENQYQSTNPQANLGLTTNQSSSATVETWH